MRGKTSYQVFPPQVLSPQNQGLHHQHAGDTQQGDDHQESLDGLLLRGEHTQRGRVTGLSRDDPFSEVVVLDLTAVYQ